VRAIPEPVDLNRLAADVSIRLDSMPNLSGRLNVLLAAGLNRPFSDFVAMMREGRTSSSNTRERTEPVAMTLRKKPTLAYSGRPRAKAKVCSVPYGTVARRAGAA
jgi:hypothetical protein